MGRTRMMPPNALVEHALAYQVRPFSGYADGAGASLMAFPIARCSLDVLLMIFQELTDEEAVSYKVQSYMPSIQPRMAPLLALVSRQWKNIVYNSPRLWAVVAVDATTYLPDLLLSSQIPRTQHYIERAKGAPVDLYLSRYPTSECEDGNITSSILNIVPNIRRLHVQFVMPDYTKPVDTPLILRREWPALRNIRELSYSVFSYHHLFPIDLTPHMKGMPRLSALRLPVSMLTLPHRSAGPPFLLQLKFLSIERSFLNSDRGEADRLTSFLSHAPQIQELEVSSRLRGTLETPSPDSQPLKLSLSCLRTIKSQLTITLTPFISGEISTPRLETVILTKLNQGFASVNFCLIASWFTRIFNTLTTLTIHVTDTTPLEQLFSPLVRLRTLSLIGDGKGQFLAPLYNPIAPTVEDNNDATALYLPSLRFLVLSICRGLAVEHFKKLVAARCMPVDAERTTAMGYPVLDNFVIITLNAPCLLQHVMRTSEWDSAGLRESGGMEFELRWEYWEPEEVEPVPNQRKARRKAPKASKTPNQGTRRSIRMVTSRAKGKGGAVA